MLHEQESCQNFFHLPFGCIYLVDTFIILLIHVSWLLSPSILGSIDACTDCVDSFSIFLIHWPPIIFLFLSYLAYICCSVCCIYFETAMSAQECRCVLLGAAIMNLALVTAIPTLHVLLYIFVVRHFPFV